MQTSRNSGFQCPGGSDFLKLWVCCFQAAFLGPQCTGIFIGQQRRGGHAVTRTPPPANKITHTDQERCISIYYQADSKRADSQYSYKKCHGFLNLNIPSLLGLCVICMKVFLCSRQMFISLPAKIRMLLTTCGK